MNRRSFLKSFGIGVAAATIIPSVVISQVIEAPFCKEYQAILDNMKKRGLDLPDYKSKVAGNALIEQLKKSALFDSVAVMYLPIITENGEKRMNAYNFEEICNT